MSNDVADLTDQFNELLKTYALGVDEPHVMDLDAWDPNDLADLHTTVSMILTLQGIDIPEIPTESIFEEYEAMSNSIA